MDREKTKKEYQQWIDASPEERLYHMKLSEHADWWYKKMEESYELGYQEGADSVKADIFIKTDDDLQIKE